MVDNTEAEVRRPAGLLRPAVWNECLRFYENEARVRTASSAGAVPIYREGGAVAPLRAVAGPLKAPWGRFWILIPVYLNLYDQPQDFEQYKVFELTGRAHAAQLIT